MEFNGNRHFINGILKTRNTFQNVQIHIYTYSYVCLCMYIYFVYEVQTRKSIHHLSLANIFPGCNRVHVCVSVFILSSFAHRFMQHSPTILEGSQKRGGRETERWRVSAKNEKSKQQSNRKEIAQLFARCTVHTFN